MLKSGENGLIGPGSNDYGRAVKKVEDLVPRKSKIWLNVPIEVIITDAIQKIEHLGADTRLTEAQILLGKAKDLVSEYIDEELTK